MHDSLLGSLPFVLLLTQLACKLFPSQKQGRVLRRGQEKRVEHSARSLVSNVGGGSGHNFETLRTLEGKNPIWGLLGVCGRNIFKNVTLYWENEICFLEVDL